jgi:hypothetical protein
MTSTGLFEEQSFLCLGTDKFKCKEQNGKTAIRTPDTRSVSRPLIRQENLPLGLADEASTKVLAVLA